MKRTIALLISAILFASVVVLSVVPDIQAQAGCTLESLTGPYGFIVAGFFQGTPPGPVATAASSPSTSVGILSSDGAGSVTVAALTQSFNGTITTSQTFTGTYTVNPDCTGSATFVPIGGGTATVIDFVILAKGSEVLFLSRNPGGVESAVARKL